LATSDWSNKPGENKNQTAIQPPMAKFCIERKFGMRSSLVSTLRFVAKVKAVPKAPMEGGKTNRAKKEI